MGGQLCVFLFMYLCICVSVFLYLCICICVFGVLGFCSWPVWVELEVGGQLLESHTLSKECCTLEGMVHLTFDQVLYELILRAFSRGVICFWIKVCFDPLFCISRGKSVLERHTLLEECCML